MLWQKTEQNNMYNKIKALKQEIMMVILVKNSYFGIEQNNCSNEGIFSQHCVVIPLVSVLFIA